MISPPFPLTGRKFVTRDELRSRVGTLSELVKAEFVFTGRERAAAVRELIPGYHSSGVEGVPPAVGTTGSSDSATTVRSPQPRNSLA